MSKVQIIIHMEGGLIQEILSPGPVEVYVYETGEDEGDEERLVQLYGEMVYLDKWDIDPETDGDRQMALDLLHKLQKAWEDM